MNGTNQTRNGSQAERGGQGQGVLLWLRIEWAFGLRTSRFVTGSGEAFNHFEELPAAAAYSANALPLAQQCVANPWLQAWESVSVITLMRVTWMGRWCQLPNHFGAQKKWNSLC